MLKTTLFASVLGLALATGAQAQSHNHHAGHGVTTPAAKPHHGAKFATDAPLRKGMETIRSLVADNMHRAHEGKLTRAEATAIGKKVDVEIQKIFSECKLEPAADQTLHGVLTKMMEGSKELQANEAAQGLMTLMKGLNEYSALFDHPGFKKITH